MMRPLPLSRARTGRRAHLHMRARLLLGTLAFAAACGGRDIEPSADSVAAPPPMQPLTAAPATTTASPLIGQLLDSVAPDSALLSSWGVFPLERHIGIRLVAINGEQYLLADTLVGYSGDRARWRIRQAQRVEAAKAGEAWVGSCAIGGADASDGTVVARVTLSAGEALTPVHSAWRLDPATWQFRRFPVDSLSCYNEGGGNP